MYARIKKRIFIKCGRECWKKNVSNIIVWKTNDLDDFFFCSNFAWTFIWYKFFNWIKRLKISKFFYKDRTIRIWKSFIKEDKNNNKIINFRIDEILSEFKHLIYGLIQLTDGRLFSSSSNFSIVVWRDKKFFVLLLKNI